MIILALDTTGRRGSLALARDGSVLETITAEAPDGFAQVVYREVHALIARHGLSLADIDGYASASGPGSFTGIRVGLTTVKALAEVHGKRIVTVSNLLAVAAQGEGRYRAPVMDARRGEVFCAVYDEQLRPVIDEAVIAWPLFLQSVADRGITFVAQDTKIFESEGAAAWPTDADPQWRRMTVAEPLAPAIARLAAGRFARGETLVPEAVDANYVRRTDAELKWRDPADAGRTQTNT